jgi:hypothetical protein
VIPSDTTADAFAEHVRYYRRIGRAGRLQLALELSDDARRLAADGVRRRRPELGGDDVRREVLRMFGAVPPARR